MKIQFRPLLALTVSLICVVFVGVAQASPLKAGAARVDITSLAYPDGNMPPMHYEHEHLYVRAIVLDNGTTRVALLGADMSNLGDGVWDKAAPQIARMIDAPVENIIMSATHTHSGIRDQKLASADDYAKAMVQAVKQAKASLRPASVGYGTGKVYLNVNRDAIDPDTHHWTQGSNADAPSDKTLAVLAFYDKQGRPIAGYMNYAMHPINGYLSGFISADFPGAATRHIEKAFGDNMVMIFTQGASGDQNPLYLRNSTNVMASASGVPVTGFEMKREPIEAPLREGKVKRRENNPEMVKNLKDWIQAEGMVIGEEAISVMSHMDHLTNDVHFGASQAVLTCPGRVRTNSGREGMAGTYKNGPAIPIRLGFLGINDIALTTVDAEIYNLIGQEVKKESPLSKTMVVTLANGRAPSGYIPTDNAFGHQTFQVLGSKLKPGCAESGIVGNLTDMVYNYLR